MNFKLLPFLAGLVILIRDLYGIPLASFCSSNHIQYDHKCCIPIAPPNFCGTNRYIKRCEENGESDQCMPCAPGTFKFHNSTSRSDIVDECARIHCPEEAVPSSVFTDCGYCKCDETRGYTGDPCSCTKIKECGDNTYLKDGHCVACPFGTHREGLGYGPCVPSPASGNSYGSSATQGVEPNTVVPTTSPLTEKQTFSPGFQNEMNTSKEINEMVEETDGQDSTMLIVVIVAVAVALVCIMLLLVILVQRYLRKRRYLRKPQSNQTTTAEANNQSEPLVFPNGSPKNDRGVVQNAVSDSTSRDSPPPYSENPSSYNTPPGEIIPRGLEAPREGERQGAVPFTDSPRSPATYAETLSWPSLSSENPSSAHSQSAPDADQTDPKCLPSTCTHPVQEEGVSPPRNAKAVSSVIPEKSEDSTPLLKSVPSLDPNSIENDS